VTATIIDGKHIAETLRADIAWRVATLKQEHRITPGLAVVLVGNDPASEVYVRNKGRQTTEAGMQSFEHTLPDTTTQKELLTLIARLNADKAVHGILVQLPLPRQIDPNAVIEAIAPEKDVDGFHPVNIGKMLTGQAAMLPCTPLGCMLLLDTLKQPLAGKHAVVIGRSNIVGKPVAALLLGANCTVTIAHSKTVDLPALCRSADILVAATGKAEMVKGDWIKPGAIVIDVGINRIALADGKTRLVGDVAFDEAVKAAGAITPVPGGVGPMTIACLLGNTLEAACRQHGVTLES
jgi:methylenetetrahydrofolate dehydrogenase (NADP+)/methenyltetrahydrofolate cyclohydrolase